MNQTEDIIESATRGVVYIKIIYTQSLYSKRKRGQKVKQKKALTIILLNYCRKYIALSGCDTKIYVALTFVFVLNYCNIFVLIF